MKTLIFNPVMMQTNQDIRELNDRINKLENCIEILHNMITLISRHLNLEVEDDIIEK